MRIWKDVKGYEGLYQVSDKGEVKRLWKSKTSILKPINILGYCYVNLCKNGNAKKIGVHRLVAEAFIPNPACKPQVNHKNELKSDNRVENLEWVTAKENQNYGTIKARKAQNYANWRKKKPVLQMANGKVINRYNSLKEASEATGISTYNISRCCHDILDTVRKFQWKFDNTRQ